MRKDKFMPRVSPPAPGVTAGYDPGLQTFSFTLGNVAAHDAHFIGEVVKLFTDPLNAGLMDHIKHGRMAIVYKGGRAELTPVFGRN
jgi:hypothetical protein